MLIFRPFPHTKFGVPAPPPPKLRIPSPPDPIEGEFPCHWTPSSTRPPDPAFKARNLADVSGFTSFHQTPPSSLPWPFRSKHPQPRSSADSFFLISSALASTAFGCFRNSNFRGSQSSSRPSSRTQASCRTMASGFSPSDMAANDDIAEGKETSAKPTHQSSHSETDDTDDNDDEHRRGGVSLIDHPDPSPSPSVHGLPTTKSRKRSRRGGAKRGNNAHGGVPSSIPEEAAPSFVSQQRGFDPSPAGSRHHEARG